MIRNREDFLAAVPGVESVVVDVPRLGEVRVRGMTAGQRDRFERAAQGSGAQDTRARVVVASVVGDDEKPLFTADDVAAVAAMPACVVEPIVMAAMKLNAITKADVDELEKN